MFLFFLSMLITFLCAQELNTELIHNYQYEANVNDIWGYSTPLGDEYAIVGLQNGTSIVFVSQDEIYEVAFIPGENSTWRDIKEWNNHIYIGTENGSGGIQIVSMENPSNPELIQVWDGIGSSHNIMIDDGYLYIIGADNEDLYILDLQNPSNPELIGTWSGDYFHDVCIKNDLLFGCAIGTNMMHILDISDKSNPYSIGFFEDVPAAHACWVDPLNDVLVTASETTGGHIMNWDISNLNDIQLISEWAPDSSESKSAHNVFIRDNYAYISYYVFGLQILDITNPTEPQLAGYYDTYPGMDGLFNGAWGTYPYQPSCNIYISDRQTGLYVIKFEDCLGVDPEDPIPPQNFTVYSDYLTQNLVQLNWENSELLYDNTQLLNFDIFIYENSQLIEILNNSENSYIRNNLIDGENYTYKLIVKDTNTDSLSIPVSKSVWVGGHPNPNPPQILSSQFNNLNVQIELRMPSFQHDNTPLDDLAYLIAIRNGSIIDTTPVIIDELILFQDNPFNGYFYEYNFFVVDNESPVNLSEISNPIEIYAGQYPSNLIIPLCQATTDNALHFQQDLTRLDLESLFLTINQFLDLESYTNIQNLFLFSGIFPNDCNINENIQNKLSNLLSNGKNIYLEGSDIWTNLNHTNLYSQFNINVISNIDVNFFEFYGVNGSLTEGLILDYMGQNNWIDYLHSIPPAYPILTDFNLEYALTIANPQENFNTIANSFELAGISDEIQRLILIQNIIEFLINSNNPNWIKGDVNYNNIVNIIDIILIIEFIIEIQNPNEVEYWISDLNDDDIINIQDITLIINQILAN